jgi:hypothetical protein
MCQAGLFGGDCLADGFLTAKPMLKILNAALRMTRTAAHRRNRASSTKPGKERANGSSLADTLCGLGLGLGARGGVGV